MYAPSADEPNREDVGSLGGIKLELRSKAEGSEIHGHLGTTLQNNVPVLRCAGMASSSHDRDAAAEVKAEAEIADSNSMGSPQTDREDTEDKWLDMLREYERDHL